jgi:hypothetical protein
VVAGGGGGRRRLAGGGGGRRGARAPETPVRRADFIRLRRNGSNVRRCSLPFIALRAASAACIRSLVSVCVCCIGRAKPDAPECGRGLESAARDCAHRYEGASVWDCDGGCGHPTDPSPPLALPLSLSRSRTIGAAHSSPGVARPSFHLHTCTPG